MSPVTRSYASADWRDLTLPKGERHESLSRFSPTRICLPSLGAARIGLCQKSTLVMLGTVKTRMRLGMQRLKLLLQESV